MGKRLEDNGLWESSRMILPEHREAMLAETFNAKTKIKPILDEQEWDVILAAIRDSLNHKHPVSLRVYDQFEDLRLVGIVERVQSGQIRMDGEWFRINDIIGVDDAS